MLESAQQRAFRGIRESEIYLALVGPAWPRDLMVQAQADYAASLGKPCVAILLDGQPLPAELDHDGLVATVTVGPGEFADGRFSSSLEARLAEALERARAGVPR